MIKSYREAVIQRNAAIAAFKEIVKSRNVFKIWTLAYAALRNLPSTEAARKELAALNRQDKKVDQS